MLIEDINMLEGIKEILKNSKVIKIKDNLLVANYKNWTVKIEITKESMSDDIVIWRKYSLYNHGVFLDSVSTFDDDFSITCVSLRDHIKSQNNKNL